MDERLRHEPIRWQPAPDRTPDSWPAAAPTGPDLPGWLEERLFDRRIVVLHGPLTGALATYLSAALLSLDAAGSEPVQLQMTSPGGDLAAAFAVIDAMDAMTAPVHAVVTAQAGGAVIAVLAAAQRRSAYQHARFRLVEPRAAGVTGTADEVAAAAGQHLRELEEVILRLAEVTGQPRSRVEDDLSAGRMLSAHQARDYGLIDAVIGDEPPRG
ncbi:MAG TPA: ATP-dependent Clp protease proteolytic subunit [Actinoplanes sp.]|nr:ATP-dependent Clp protease proteolytic subunit [Actinoplanes sp.]